MKRDREPYRDPKQWLWWGIPIAVVVAVALVLYFGRTQTDVQPEEQIVEQPPPSEPEPGIQYPLEETPTEEPLPPLAESDPPVQESLTTTFGDSLKNFLVPKDIVRHFVVTVDNLPRAKAAVQMWPVKPVEGEFLVEGTEENLVLSPRNYARYTPMVKLLQGASAAQIGAVYRRFYPLLQQAYEDIGYPDAYFNDRLVEVIDHLLETPEVRDPIRLVHPTVRYHYADPELEARSAGQKALIRMGPQNAAIVKHKLRELRAEIVRQAEQERASQDTSGTTEPPGTPPERIPEP